MKKHILIAAYTILLFLLIGCRTSISNHTASTNNNHDIGTSADKLNPVTNGTVGSIPSENLEYNSTTVELSTDEESEVYTGDDWNDTETVWINCEENTGSVTFIIRGTTESGRLVYIGTSDAVAPGSSWSSIIIARSYTTITVTAKAIDEDGTYEIRYAAL